MDEQDIQDFFRLLRKTLYLPAESYSADDKILYILFIHVNSRNLTPAGGYAGRRCPAAG